MMVILVWKSWLSKGNLDTDIGLSCHILSHGIGSEGNLDLKGLDAYMILGPFSTKE